MKIAGKKICIVTLGCARNIVDSEKVLGDALAAGVRVVTLGQAHTAILNTCGFTEEAKRESLEAIEELLRHKRVGRLKAVYVIGCLAQRYQRELEKEFPDIDGFRGIADFKTDHCPEARLTPAHTAYVKIAEGCANTCTYCAIPLIKGRLLSRPEAQILREVKSLDEQGVKEVNIVGQDITLYGRERRGVSRGLSLVRLVRSILKETRIPWVRLLYLHPKRLTDELIDLMAEESRICSYVDVPLQHVNTRILKAMGRGMTRAQVFGVIEKLRRRIPGAAVRTSFIVGFPGETQWEFRELCAAVTELRFDRMGVFMYSREEGTAAYGLAGQRASSVKRERMDHLMRLQAEVSASLLHQDVGRSLDVLIESEGKRGVFIPHPAPYDGAGGIPPYRQKTKRGVSGVRSWSTTGRSYKDAPEVDGVVRVRSPRRLRPGDLVRCRITESCVHDLSGEQV